MTEDRQPEIQDIEDQLEEDAEDSSDLEERLEEAERERDQFRTLALRYKADLENYKKRAASELNETRERANAQLLLKLIGLSDDFNRALDYIPEDTSGDGWVEGLRLTQRSIENVMQTEGLSRIEAAIGQPFDVYEHEAVFFEPTNEVDEGTVVPRREKRIQTQESCASRRAGQRGPGHTATGKYRNRNTRPGGSIDAQYTWNRPRHDQLVHGRHRGRRTPGYRKLGGRTHDAVHGGHKPTIQRTLPSAPPPSDRQ